MTTKTKVCLQNHPKISDLIFSSGSLKQHPFT